MPKSFSSSPLTSLFPDTSPDKEPQYQNALSINPFTPNQFSATFPNYAQQYAQNMQPIVKSAQYTAGKSLSQSSSTLTRIQGNDMLQKAQDFTYVTPFQDNKKSFSDKFNNSTFGKNYSYWNTGLSIANTAFTSLFGENSEHSGKEGHITQAMDSAYDTVQNIAGNFGPVGQAISLGMGANKLLGNVADKLGGGTDGMTKVDSILGSSFLQLTPLGLINGFGGKRADTITKNTDVFEQMGTSYSGSENKVDNALTKSGKKYGLFSNKARERANQEIAEAKRQQLLISDIQDETNTRRLLASNMSSINGLRTNYLMSGGLDTSSIRVGRNGMNIKLLNEVKQIVKQSKKLQVGGSVPDPFEVYLQSLPEYQRYSTNFRVRDYWEYNGRPKNFDEARKKGMFEWKEDFDESGKSLGWSWHAFTVAKNPNADEYDFMKSPSHPTVQKEIDWYNSDAGSEFRKEYELQKVQPYYKYVKRKAPYKDVPIHKEGGSIIELVSLPTEILLVDPAEIPEFQEGGSINVIPDGALHARKHNMDMDGITKKGIPVVAENKDGSIEQQAEIEKEEIIFRLEVTKKLEELQKKFYDEEASKEEKDQLALEAGKLLAEEILHNTIDNTNNLL